MKSFKEFTEYSDVYVPELGEMCAVSISPFNKSEREGDEDRNEFDPEKLIGSISSDQSGDYDKLHEGVYVHIDSQNNKAYASVPSLKFACLVEFDQIKKPADEYDVSTVYTTEAANIWNRLPTQLKQIKVPEPQNEDPQPTTTT